MIVVKRLAFGVFFEQRLLQTFEQALVLDIGTGIMDEYTRFHVAIGVDMAIVPATGYTSVNILTVVLEIDGKNRFTAFDTADFADTAYHIGPLFFRRHQVRRRVVTDGHIMEIPGEISALADQQVEKIIRCNRFNILAGVTDGRAKDDAVFPEQIHGMHDLIEMAGTAAAVVDFPISFDTEGKAQIAYIGHFMTKGIVNEGPIGKRMEFAIGMFTAEADDIGFADEWFPAGQQIEMTAQFLALGHDFIHHIERQIQRMAVFGSQHPIQCILQALVGSKE